MTETPSPLVPMQISSITKPTNGPLDPVYFDFPLDSGKPVKDLLENYNGVLSDPLGFARQIEDAVNGKGWRAYERPLGARILYSGYHAEMMKALLESPVLLHHIHELAEKKVDNMALSPKEERERDKVVRRVERGLKGIAKGMAGDLVAKIESPRLIKTYGVVLANIFARLYQHGVHINVDEVVRLREVAAECEKKKQSLVFLPCHKSHIDYLLISWLCFRLGLNLPHIFAGDNLDLPIVGPLLRRGGAFFVRRAGSWNDDELYPKIANEYITQLLEKGHNLECFIEGTRSRTGKLLPPKFGALKIILDAVLSGRASDVMLVPVSVQYDKVIEAGSYVAESLGAPKEKESLAGLASATSVLGLKLGRIDVRFGGPYSIKTLLEEQTQRRAPASSDDALAFDVTKSAKDKDIFLRNVGYRVLSDINASSVAMPSALVATALLTLRTLRGVSKQELVRRVEWLIQTIQKRGGRVVDFGERSIVETVDKTLVVLKDLIGHRKANEVVEETIYPLKSFELSLLRNELMHVFVREGLLAAALYLKVKTAVKLERMPIQEVMEETRFLSDLLRIEFIFPTTSLEVNVQRTLEVLQEDGVLDVDEDSVGLSETELSNGRETYDFYLFMVWPFIESYWLASVSLFGLIPASPGSVTAWVSQPELISKAQALGKTLFWQGDLSYLESVSTNTLSNAFRRFAELGILQTRKKGKLTLVALRPEWARNEERLVGWAEKVGAFRREGKSRRTNLLASRRVWSLSKKCAPSLNETTVDEPEGTSVTGPSPSTAPVARL